MIDSGQILAEATSGVKTQRSKTGRGCKCASQALADVRDCGFVAPVYDVAANLTAFGCAVAASVLLGHWVPALLSAEAIGCWFVLARRTILARRR
jgi:hypothetical protein